MPASSGLIGASVTTQAARAAPRSGVEVRVHINSGTYLLEKEKLLNATYSLSFDSQNLLSFAFF